ncbi:hypothetical protein NDU88_001641 [Pleurodeles waltl]|uniref:Uncharacterized protein n=1 Tax=Pleurodeles waltl TaxID=8319 RepID=A0AAV7R9N9_PLEWA|nr:hypothetical protein NDU88_001641 [Pleurodeles waltl]
MAGPPAAGGTTRPSGGPDPGVHWVRGQPGPQATSNPLLGQPVPEQPAGVLPLPPPRTRRRAGPERLGPKVLSHPCGKHLCSGSTPQICGRCLDPCMPDREVHSFPASHAYPHPGGCLDQDGAEQENRQSIVGPRAELFKKHPLRPSS